MGTRKPPEKDLVESIFKARYSEFVLRFTVALGPLLCFGFRLYEGPMSDIKALLAGTLSDSNPNLNYTLSFHFLFRCTSHMSYLNSDLLAVEGPCQTPTPPLPELCQTETPTMPISSFIDFVFLGHFLCRFLGKAHQAI